jgi:hypothetical protein
MSTLGPLDHLARPPLPWRLCATLTECGKTLTELDPARVITADTLARRIRDLGKQRAAYTTCMTCADTAERWRSIDPEPLVVFLREAEAVQYRTRRNVARREALTAEVEAITALIAAHREEFDGYLADRSATVSLDTVRRARR